MKFEWNAKRTKRRMEQLKREIREERRAFIELHRIKRRQLDELQAKLHEALEMELELIRRLSEEETGNERTGHEERNARAGIAEASAASSAQAPSRSDHQA